LSRPQFLISTLDVIAEVDRPEGDQATVREVHGPTTEEDKKLVGQTVAVVNLAECEGWSGPGLYILPLMSDGKGHYMVAHTPPSPGFEPNPFTRAGRPHIYPVTRETRQQLDQIQKPQP